MSGTFGTTIKGGALALWGLLFELMVAAGLVILILYAVRACRRTVTSDDLVSRRFKLQLARGDISLDEYEELRSQLPD
jgi:uncharacterized membrane protein